MDQRRIAPILTRALVETLSPSHLFPVAAAVFDLALWLRRIQRFIERGHNIQCAEHARYPHRHANNHGVGERLDRQTLARGYSSDCGPVIRQTRRVLRENLLDKMMGAPGLAFETWDPPRKCLRTRALTHAQKPRWNGAPYSSSRPGGLPARHSPEGLGI